ncbi:MAG: PEP-CTERM sorting domain-containing protein [bacterium]
MRAIHWTITTAVVFCAVVAGAAGSSFSLHGTEHLDVTTSYDQGWLWGSSTADVLENGSIGHYAYVNNEAMLAVHNGGVNNLYAYQSSTVVLASGHVNNIRTYDNVAVHISGGNVAYIRAQDSTAIDLSGGSVFRLRAYKSSAVHLSEGSVSLLHANDSTAVALSGGYVKSLFAHNTSTVDISRDSVTSSLYAYDSSTVDISGDSVCDLHPRGDSVSLRAWGGSVSIYGHDFEATDGLELVEIGVIDDEPWYEVVGTGILTGKVFDDTSWAIEITANDGSIYAIPEPATLAMLGLGGLAVVLRRRRR